MPSASSAVCAARVGTGDSPVRFPPLLSFRRSASEPSEVNAREESALRKCGSTRKIFQLDCFGKVYCRVPHFWPVLPEVGILTPDPPTPEARPTRAPSPPQTCPSLSPSPRYTKDAVREGGPPAQ